MSDKATTGAEAAEAAKIYLLLQKKFPSVPKADIDKMAKAIMEIKEGKKCASTYKQRLSQTPKTGGRWTGQRGESTFIHNDEKVNAILRGVDKEGIAYTDAIPDFSALSRGTIEIQGMSASRPSNFSKADKELAKQKGVTPKQVREWREKNKYTWHECNNMKTMQKVPFDINDKFGHLGGVGEVNCLNAILSN
ncbi:MAG TPA: HNH endonuclease [Pseudobacteroides sp.]|uniref:HNH endonuclease n=1 Tax=Pseudobacteroides sp. TaxID=1968840 RepID=UPI002F95578F